MIHIIQNQSSVKKIQYVKKSSFSEKKIQSVSKFQPYLVCKKSWTHSCIVPIILEGFPPIPLFHILLKTLFLGGHPSFPLFYWNFHDRKEVIPHTWTTISPDTHHHVHHTYHTWFALHDHFEFLRRYFPSWLEEKQWFIRLNLFWKTFRHTYVDVLLPGQIKKNDLSDQKSVNEITRLLKNIQAYIVDFSLPGTIERMICQPKSMSP